jgi:phosphate transport system substrate-binding protein
VEIRGVEERRIEKGTTLRSRTRAFLGLAAVVPALALPATSGAATLFGSGSSAEQPILNVLFRGYNKLHHNIRFNFLSDGGNAGVKDVQAGRREFAVNTRPPLPSDSRTTQFKLFLDGLCVAVNPSNSLSNLSIAQTKDIFTGVDTNWSQVGGNLSSTIDPVGRNSSAGSYTFFQQAVLGGASQSANVHPVTSDGLVATAIHGDKSAIGYVGLAHAGKGSGIKALRLKGVACSTANIKNETYPLFRFIWAVLPTSDPSVQVQKFISWVRTSKAAGQIISRAGAVPAFNKK